MFMNCFMRFIVVLYETFKLQIDRMFRKNDSNNSTALIGIVALFLVTYMKLTNAGIHRNVACIEQNNIMFGMHPLIFPSDGGWVHLDKNCIQSPSKKSAKHVLFARSQYLISVPQRLEIQFLMSI